MLLISPRAPEADGKGDAIRAHALLAAMQRSHRVEVVVPEVSAARRAIAAIADLLSGRPAQVGFCMPRAAWPDVRAAAARADVVVAITVRAVRGPVGAPLVVDHVDALSLNWAQRAGGPEGRWRRRGVRLEAGRLRRWESAVAGWAVAQLVVSELDAVALPAAPPVVVVPHVVAFTPPPDVARDIDVVFTGNMRYPPNMEAAIWLDREIAPALRALAPTARVVVVGRDAGRLGLRNCESMSDVPSVPAVLVRSRVAIVPLSGIGTGIPTKGLEAAACGAALVVTPWTFERLPLPARVASDALALAAEMAALLADEPARVALAQAGRAAVARYGLDQLADQLDVVLAAASSGRRSSATAAPTRSP